MRSRTFGAEGRFLGVARPSEQRRIARYGVALAVTSAAMLIALVIDQWSDEASPFPLLLAAVMISSWYGGLGPGLLSIAIGFPFVSFVFIEPVNSLAVATLVGIERLGAFLLVALLINWLNSRRIQAETRLMSHAAQQQVLTELGSELAGTNLNLPAILQTAATRTTEVIGDGCLVRLVGPDGESLDPVAYDHRDDRILTCLRDLLVADPAAFCGALARQVARSGSSMSAPDDLALRLDTPTNVPDQTCPADLAASTMLILPLLHRDRVLGTLTVWRHGTPYSDDDKRFLQELATCVALAIDNGRLYSEARAAEARYRGLFDRSADAILVSDTEGRILDANDAASELFAGHNGAAQNLHVRELVAGDWPSPVDSCSGEHCARDWRGELDVRRRDGALIPVEASVTTVALPTRTVVLSTLRDITERRRLEQAQREFVSSISHDLRTPLTAIRTGVALLLQHAADRLHPAERELLGHAQMNSERLSRLIDDLLALNQLEAGTHALDCEPLDLRLCVTSAVAAVYAPLREKQQTLELDLPTPLPVNGDQGRLEQVMCNLLGNAHHHTPRGTRILVVGRAAAEEIRLTVLDTGPGIPETEHDTIFARFHRLDPNGSGSGLGLAIARRLTEAHGGRLWAEETPGGGATFQLALPRYE